MLTKLCKFNISDNLRLATFLLVAAATAGLYCLWAAPYESVVIPMRIGIALISTGACVGIFGLMMRASCDGLYATWDYMVSRLRPAPIEVDIESDDTQLTARR